MGRSHSLLNVLSDPSWDNTTPKGWWVAHGGVVSVPGWCSDSHPIQPSCVQVCVICATVQDRSILAPCTFSGNRRLQTDCYKCDLGLWAKSCDKGHKPKHTHIFWFEVAIYVQELLSFQGISCASYFLFRETILFISWHSTVITELQFLKERDPGRMRKRPDPSWCCPMF